MMTGRAKEGAEQVFEKYAHFYDALYEDKNYEAECDFLERTFVTYAAGPVKTVLDLGCGTGGHAMPLARRGYEVVGVDRSREMLAQARDKAAEAGLSAVFELGDVCDLDLGRTFDAVIAMFAVVSYQCANDELAAMMASARRQLKPGGLFVFDAWFGPGVLAQRPTERTKTIDFPDGVTITRSATPSLDIMAHTVEVRYRVTRSKGDKVLEESEEAHTVRFLFPQETVNYLSQAGFELAAMGPFMEPDKEPTEGDWNISVVAKAGQRGSTAQG